MASYNCIIVWLLGYIILNCQPIVHSECRKKYKENGPKDQQLQQTVLCIVARPFVVVYDDAHVRLILRMMVTCMLELTIS